MQLHSKKASSSAHSKNFEILVDKLPSDDYLERTFIGMVIVEPELFSEVDGFVSEETFLNEVYKEIFKVICEIHKAGSELTIATVSRRLSQKDKLEFCGGAIEISQITNVSFGEPIKKVALLLEELLMRRKVIIHSIESTKKAFDLSEDIFETVEFASRITDKSIMSFQTEADLKPDYRIGKTMWTLNKAMNNRGATGIPSGLWGLDSSTGGWQNGDLIIVAGRPGMGKTALLMNLMYNAESAGYPVAVFQMEMQPEQVGMREISMINRIAYSKIKRGNISIQEYEHISTKVVEEWKKKRIFFEWKSSVSIQFIKSRLSKMKVDFGIKIAMIDYLNLMSTDKVNGKSREREIAEIVEGLKSLAKDLDIPILLVAQLNRANEATESKKPSLHNLRDSGSIEAAADIVLLLYRPEYYIREKEFGSKGERIKNILIVDIAKNKQGGTGDKEFECFIDVNLIKDTAKTISEIPPENNNVIPF